MKFAPQSFRSCRREEADQTNPRPIHLLTSVATSASSCRLLRAQRWSRRRRRFGLARGHEQFPEQLPISFLHRMHIWVAGNDGAAEKPVHFPLYQFRAHRIGQRVKAETRKRISLPILLAQDVIVGLMLPLTTVAQGWLKVGAEKLHGVELIALPAHAHPDEMKMVGHQAVGGAVKSFAGGGMKHQFTKPRVQDWGQPSACAFLQRIRPKHHGVTLILMSFQSREFPFARWRHDVDMEFTPRNVKTVAQSPATRSRRRTEADQIKLSAFHLLTSGATSTSSRRWLRIPPPHVGGYDA